MGSEFCYKCREDGHPTKDCPNKWPPPDSQTCDWCGKSCDSYKCSNMGSPSCSECGHAGHTKKECFINWRHNADNINQYTPSSYKKALAAKKKEEAKPAKNPGAPKTQPSSSQQKGLAHRGKALSGQASSEPLEPPVTNENMQERLKAMPIAFLEIAPPPVRTLNEQQKYDWEQLNLDLCPFQTSTAPVGTQTALANSFVVSFDEKFKSDIRKYRIVFGKLHNGDDEIEDKDKKGKGTATPEKDNKPPKRETARALLEDLFSNQRPPDSKAWVSDYFTEVVSVGKLYEDMADNEEPGQTYSLWHYRSGRGDEGYQRVESRIIYEHTLDRDSLKKYCNGKVPTRPKDYFPDKDIRILNMISWSLVNDASFDGGRVGKKFYPTQQDPRYSGGCPVKKTPGHGQRPVVLYDIKTGFFSSMRPSHNDLLLNVNSTTSAFYPPWNLQEWINKRWPSNKAGPSIPPDDGKALKGLRVIFEGDNLTDRAGKKRVIWSISSESVSEQKFELKKENGLKSHVSVYDYMRDHKDYKKLNTNARPFNKRAACVNLGGDSERWYPADKLKIGEWQPVRRKLDDQEGEGMVDYAARSPEQNRDLILDHARGILGINPPGTLRAGSQERIPSYQEFGLAIEKDFLEFKPMRLRIPELIFGEGLKGGTSRTRKEKSGRIVETPGSWNLRDVKIEDRTPRSGKGFFSVQNDLVTISMIVLCNYSDPGNTRWLNVNLAPKIIPELQKYGFKTKNFAAAEALLPQTHIDSDYRNELGVNLSKAWEELQHPSLMLVQLPQKDKALYSHVKWWGDCHQGVPTVCVTFDKLAVFDKPVHQSMSLMGNLALKINVKLKGTNHCVRDVGAYPNTMVVGADVTHPSKDSPDAAPSIAGLVATYDVHYAQYLPSARLQGHNEEYIHDLEGMMGERLRAYESLNNGNYPDHILFYRDGVSESQFGMVKAREIPQVERAIQNVGLSSTEKRCNAQVTFLVVGKRHHARFYPKDPKTGPPNFGPGMLVTSHVVAPKQFNFYLQSHDSALGTARSGHYAVFKNDSNYDAAKLQQVTNNLCSMSSRALHTLSVCTPARYADFLCDRLRMYMRPALAKNATVPSGNTSDAILAGYRQNPLIWGQGRNNQTGMNPWHQDLNDVMFYL